MPFVAGVIENNLVADTIGYNMEIKHQTSLPAIPGMPLEPTVTVVRNNVFIKDDRPSEDGDRPNVLIGPVPFTGPGSLNSYELYGNVFFHNHREALLQAAGRVSVHDNIFVDGPYSYPAIVFRNQYGPVKVAYFYNNTVLTSGRGLYFGHRATLGDGVVGNAIFASTPAISGNVMVQTDNLVDSVENASRYLRKPSFEIGSIDLFPLHDRCQGAPIDLSAFRSDSAFTRDFNGRPKAQSKGAVVYRGAYAADAVNPGWQVQRAFKPPNPPVPSSAIDVVWFSPSGGQAGRRMPMTVVGSNLKDGAVEISGPGVTVSNPDGDATELKAFVTIAPDAPAGTRQLVVRTSTGVSGPLAFRVSARH
jgi:hypothetical protein